VCDAVGWGTRVNKRARAGYLTIPRNRVGIQLGQPPASHPPRRPPSLWAGDAPSIHTATLRLGSTRAGRGDTCRGGENCRADTGRCRGGDPSIGEAPWTGEANRDAWGVTPPEGKHAPSDPCEEGPPREDWGKAPLEGRPSAPYTRCVVGRGASPAGGAPPPRGTG